MSFTHDETPAADFGPLTLDDLALRSEKSYADHMATYTATEIIHQAYMALSGLDPDIYHAVETVRRLISQYREKTRQEWREAYRTWADAAGIEIPAEPAETADPADDENEV